MPLYQIYSVQKKKKISEQFILYKKKKKKNKHLNNLPMKESTKYIW